MWPYFFLFYFILSWLHWLNCFLVPSFPPLLIVLKASTQWFVYEVEWVGLQILFQKVIKRVVGYNLDPILNFNFGTHFVLISKFLDILFWYFILGLIIYIILLLLYLVAKFSKVERKNPKVRFQWKTLIFCFKNTHKFYWHP